MPKSTRIPVKEFVAPLAGARIEIPCGHILDLLLGVAPLAGARIEMGYAPDLLRPPFVAPLAGARIEISTSSKHGLSKASLPSRERGLKSMDFDNFSISLEVAPLAGARIEISV